MSCSAKMRKLSVRIDADLKAAFEGTLRDIGVDPTCAMRSFAFQIVLGDVGQDPGGRRRRDGVRAQRPGHELLAGREAARAADDRAGRDTVRRRHPPEGELRGGQLRGKLRALLLGKAPCPLEHAEAGRAPMRMLREHGRRDVCCMCKRLS